MAISFDSEEVDISHSFPGKVLDVVFVKKITPVLHKIWFDCNWFSHNHKSIESQFLKLMFTLKGRENENKSRFH